VPLGERSVTRLSRTMTRLCIGILVLCYAASPGVSWSAESEETAFGVCAAGAKHAAVPEIRGLTYDAARKKILAAGWRPRVTRLADGTKRDYEEEFDNAAIFWLRGYKEVDECAPTGSAACSFNFVDKAGNRLTVCTSGEELELPNVHATVDCANLLCRK